MFKVSDYKFNSTINDDPVAEADDIWFEFEQDSTELLRKYLTKFEGRIVQDLLRNIDTCSVGFTCLYTQEAEALKMDSFPPLAVVLTVGEDVYLLDPIEDFLENITPDDVFPEPQGYLKGQLEKFLQELTDVKHQVEALLKET